MNIRAALELSIGTIVVIVIGMAMLALGLILVQNIFSGATSSVDDLNQGVKDRIKGLFNDDNDNLVILLSEGRAAKIKANGENFGIVIGARTPDGSAVGGNSRLQYILELDKDTKTNCYNSLGERATNDLFLTNVGTYNNFGEFEGANAFARIQINIPEGTTSCTQTVYVKVKDTQGSQESYSGDFFDIEIAKPGIFG